MVDIVNFFLIWITLAAAIAWPFELFLFSYIVLGPLHYLTEVNWLDKQNYFLRGKDTRVFVWSMAALVLVLTAFTLVPETNYWKATQPIFQSIYSTPGHPLQTAVKWSWTLLLVAFVASAAWVFTEKWSLRAPIMILCLLSTLLFYTVPTAAILFGIILPTIGHVFLFTILFMLHGTMKTRSGWGYANIISMGLVVVVILLYPREVQPGSLSQSVIALTLASAFDKVNFVINRWMGGKLELYSADCFKVQSFIAFAYTYHYLNWFSKTSIIKWHQVEKKKFIYSAVLWVVSLVLYKVDFRLGFAAISALSILHIVLEFPLNLVSMKGILGAVTARLRTA